MEKHGSPSLILSKHEEDGSSKKLPVPYDKISTYAVLENEKGEPIGMCIVLGRDIVEKLEC